MSQNRIPDDVARHAGFVMTQAASIAAALEVGELICPFAVVTKDENRQSIEFEAATQDQAVSKGWDSFATLKDQVDIWSLAREGLQRGPDGKEDVLVVAAWTRGMNEPAVFTQRFVPKANGGFALLGPIAISDQPSSELDRIAAGFVEGIKDHPKGHLWGSWHRD
ncbi:MAG: hypothetical protein WBE44_13370 [Terriglobales bacterium]